MAACSWTALTISASGLQLPVPQAPHAVSIPPPACLPTGGQPWPLDPLRGRQYLLQPQSNQVPTCLPCRWVALAISVYLLAVHLILYNVRRIVHVEAAYFASLNGSLMWWTYLRNLGEVVLGRVSF